jgi:hypothetical protein
MRHQQPDVPVLVRMGTALKTHLKLLKDFTPLGYGDYERLWEPGLMAMNGPWAGGLIGINHAFFGIDQSPELLFDLGIKDFPLHAVIF